MQRRYANARMPAHQRVDADREHRAHDIGAERLADADRVRDDEVVLQFFEQRAVRRFGIAARQLVARAMRAEQLVGVAAEAGRHAVDRFAALDLRRRGNPPRAARARAAPSSSATLRASARSRRRDRGSGCCRREESSAWSRRCDSGVENLQVPPAGRFAPARSSRARSASASSPRAISNWSCLRRSLTVTDSLGDLVRPEHDHEADAGAIGVLELLAELARLDDDFGVDAGIAQARSRARDSAAARASSICATSTCTVLRPRRRAGLASRNCQNSRVAPIEMPTPGSFDFV